MTKAEPSTQDASMPRRSTRYDRRIGGFKTPTFGAGHATAHRQAFGRYTLSAISVMELVLGVEKNQSTRWLQAFLA
jgi:hypothetical protein